MDKMEKFNNLYKLNNLHEQKMKEAEGVHDEKIATGNALKALQKGTEEIAR